jgi:hypothetical protein
MKPESVLLFSQEPYTGSYPELARSRSYHPIQFSTIQFNIIHPPTSWSS